MNAFGAPPRSSPLNFTMSVENPLLSRVTPIFCRGFGALGLFGIRQGKAHPFEIGRTFLFDVVLDIRPKESRYFQVARDVSVRSNIEPCCARWCVQIAAFVVDVEEMVPTA